MEVSFEHLFDDSPITPAVDDEEKKDKVAALAADNIVLGDDDLPDGEGSQEEVAGALGIEDPPGEVTRSLPSNLYSSIAAALSEDGLLTLDDEKIKAVADASDLAGLIHEQVETLLDEKQKRVMDALNAGMEPSRVQELEQAMSTLEGITEEQLRAEDDEGAKVRGAIIFQDFVNRGFAPERARREVKKSTDAGTDVEDALEALEENRKFFKARYEEETSAIKKEREKQQAEEKKRATRIEKMILETKEPFPGLALTDLQRKKVLGTWKNFAGKDEQGRPLTAIQKYALEHPAEYQYNLALLFELTNGFSNFSPVVENAVKQKRKTALEGIEKVLKTPVDRIGSGGLQFGNDRSPESRYTVNFND